LGNADLQSLLFKPQGREREREREREEKVEGGIMRGTQGKLIEKFPAQKIPMQCPLVLLVKVGWKESKALGSGLF
jgi:hypothetical protein